MSRSASAFGSVETATSGHFAYSPLPACHFSQSFGGSFPSGIRGRLGKSPNIRW